MPIDVEAALAADGQVSEICWTTTDALFYHLSLGAGAQPGDPELNYTFERDLSVLPTFGLVAGSGPSTTGRRADGTSADQGAAGAAPADDTSAGASSAGGASDESATRMRLPGIDVDLRSVLHAGQSITAHRPLPASGRADSRRKVAEIYDLGKAALIVLATTVSDADGPLWTDESRIYVRGEGGFGGPPGPDRQVVPEREPDHRIGIATRPDQALLYRLNGDANPLHVDPEFARTAGLPGPILHGLATFGMTTKALADAVAGGRPEKIRDVSAKFSGMVVPGEELNVDIWEAGDGTGAFRATVDGTGATVLDEGTFILR